MIYHWIQIIFYNIFIRIKTIFILASCPKEDRILFFCVNSLSSLSKATYCLQHFYDEVVTNIHMKSRKIIFNCLCLSFFVIILTCLVAWGVWTVTFLNHDWPVVIVWYSNLLLLNLKTYQLLPSNWMMQIIQIKFCFLVSKSAKNLKNVLMLS